MFFGLGILGIPKPPVDNQIITLLAEGELITSKNTIITKPNRQSNNHIARRRRVNYIQNQMKITLLDR